MRTRILVMTAITPILALSLMGCQTATKSLGGNTTLELEPNEIALIQIRSMLTHRQAL